MSAIYETGRQAILQADVDWISDDIKAVAVNTSSYTVNLTTHNALDDIPGGARVATSTTLSGRTATNGVADLDDFTFASVTGSQISAIVFYKDTGVESTSQLIAYVDAGPFTPNGADIDISIDNGTNRLFRL
jgi:hypothetical protein